MKLELNSYTNIESAINTIAFLKVIKTTDIGAFLATGCEKDLFLPFSEMLDPVEENDQVLVYIYLDNNNRPCSTMDIEKYLKKNTTAYQVNDEVDLIIYDETDLGYKAIINLKNLGLLYKNEIFEDLHYAQSTKGYIKKVRDDGKVDLLLRRPGHQATDDIAITLLELLKKENGYLKITDKTPPEEIYRLFKASKKKFKIALGRLYKQRLIEVKNDGIYLCK